MYQTSFQTVSVIGLGYIGLPTASLLATKGFKVQGCDINENVVGIINNGDIHIVEQGLDILVRSAVNSGQFNAFSTPQPADVFIISVPTAFRNDYTPDLSYVKAAVESLAPQIKPGNLIVLESTSPVGTTEKIAGWLRELRPDLMIPIDDHADDHNQIYLAHCPERVLPGQIIRELVDNDRIIGGINLASSERARDFYQTFVLGEILITDARTAELAKLAENAFRDVNIAFANELANICERLNINVWELIKLANHHPRVDILQPGPGVGGHCIAVDPWFIVNSAPDDTLLIKTARQVNDVRPNQVLAAIKEKAAQFFNPVIACLGLTYKADIDDLRESPALKIATELVTSEIGSKFLIVEPHLEILPAYLQLFQPRTQLAELQYALQTADIIVLLVDHKVFAHIDKNLLKNKVVIDTRGLWS